MPNIESKRKNVLKIAINNSRNNAVKSRVKTAIRKFRMEIANGATADEKVIKELLDNVKHELGKAVAKGILHPNNAARRMSRIDAIKNQYTQNKVQKAGAESVVVQK